ncbi:MAG TPA: glutathione S-transferase family protein [Rhizomicrobium sp.]|nr:glutathione S-transferase family protein [Rhizomicrobium sp.]
MSRAVLTISSRNYSSWCLRGWLMCRMAGLDFVEKIVPPDDPGARAELLLLSPSFLVPSLEHDGLRIWDTLAIGEYLREIHPENGLLPKERAARAHCRSVSGEMHAGFANLRSALPMNLKAHHPNFKIWGSAKADIARVTAIWKDCLEEYGGPYLFGDAPTMADAMYAPVCTRFKTYDVKPDRLSQDYCETILAMSDMIEWTESAKDEPEALDDLEAEF